MDVRATELVARPTATERERWESLVTISILRAARGEKTAAIKGGSPESSVLCQ